MSDGKRNAVLRLQAFIDAYLEDLQNQNDEELIGGAETESEDALRFAQIVGGAKREAGKRRLAAARGAMNGRVPSAAATTPVDLNEARRFIAQAANDARITLAARQLEEMSDEDVERLYRQLKDLGASFPKKA